MTFIGSEGNLSHEVDQCVCLRCSVAYIENKKLMVEQMVVNYQEEMSQNMVEIGETLYNMFRSDQYLQLFFQKTGTDIEKKKRIAMIQHQMLRMTNFT